MSQTGPGAGDDPRNPTQTRPRYDRPDPDDGFDDRHDDELFEGVPHDEPEPRRTRRRRGCLPMLVVLLLVLAVVFVAGRWAFGELSSRLAPPPDFAGPGKGAVLYQVKAGRVVHPDRP